MLFRSAMDKELSKVIMGQTLTAETSDKGGAYAQSKTHENVLADYQDSDQRLVKSVLERIAKIYAQINAPGVPAPGMDWFEEEDAKKEFADRDKTLSATGVKFTASYYQRQYNLQKDDFTIVAANNPPQPGKPTDSGQAGQFAEPGAVVFDAAQQALENMADTGITQASASLVKNEDLILQTVQESASYEEAMTKLLELYPRLSVDSLNTALEEALLAGEMFGVSQVKVKGGNNA